MAIFHLSVKVIGRNQGRSAVAAAAYRSAEKIVNEWDGIEHDFTKKHWVEFSEIILPEHAPPEYKNRAVLWNAVEKAEKASDARLAREVEVALPKELTREQQVQVLDDFVRRKFVDKGMIADINIHDPPVTDDRGRALDINGEVTDDIDKMVFQNPHAHILLTVRPLDENGLWQPKTQKEYLLIKDGVEKPFTPEEAKAAENDGWEKQYSYRDGKKKVWLTKSEAEEKGLARVNRTPKATKYGRQNPITESWNSKDRIFEWRNSWADICNRTFLYLNIPESIDARSFEAQGRTDEIPTVHKGVEANNLDKRMKRENQDISKYSEKGRINAIIKEHNLIIRKIKRAAKEAEKMAVGLISGIRKKLEDLRIKIIAGEYELAKIRNSYGKDEKNEYLRIKEFMDIRTSMEHDIKESKQAIEAQRRILEKTSVLALRRRSEIKDRIAEEQEKIETIDDVISSNAVKYGVDELTYKDRLRELSSVGKFIEKESTLEKENASDRKAFKREYNGLSAEEKEDFKNSNEYRQGMEDELIKAVPLEDRGLLNKSIDATDRDLGLRQSQTQKKKHSLKI